VTLLQITEAVGLVAGTGAAAVALGKGFSMARRFGHFVDKLMGNGDGGTEPGILARLEGLKTTVDDLTSAGALRDSKIDALVDSQEAMKVQNAGDLAEVKEAVHEVKVKLDEHVDSVAPSLLADGQAWGGRLEARLDALESDRHPVTRS
jgi:hypothetical protein